MPLIIPKELPAFDELSRENVFVMHRERAQSQHIRPLRILILNLMPTKIVTETQLARLLANSPLQVQITFLKTATHDTTHTPPEHMKAFYKSFDEIRNERFDGMIITGAPPCSSICWTMRLVRMCSARTLVSIICSSFSKSVCRNGPQSPKPALLMNRSMRRSAKASARRRHSLLRARSAVKISHSVVKLLESACKRSARRATSIRL